MVCFHRRLVCDTGASDSNFVKSPDRIARVNIDERAWLKLGSQIAHYGNKSWQPLNCWLQWRRIASLEGKLNRPNLIRWGTARSDKQECCKCRKMVLRGNPFLVPKSSLDSTKGITKSGLS